MSVSPVSLAGSFYRVCEQHQCGGASNVSFRALVHKLGLCLRIGAIHQDVQI